MISVMKNTKTIYIADDDEDDRMLIRIAIENVIQNVTIVEAIDGAHLLSLINREVSSHQLVIMDMNMPRMSGLETLAEIRSEDAISHIPVIMVSTASNPKLIKEAYIQGINAYITKPLYVDDYKKIANVVNLCYLNSHFLSDTPNMCKCILEKRILVIEDNCDHRILMNMALKHSLPKVVVTSVKDENSVVDFFTSVWSNITKMPHLILLDLYLPDRQNGLDVLYLIRSFLKSQQLANVPIIVLSNSDDPDDITACYRLNANAYMIKSPDVNSWHSYFSNLCHMWLETINLPVLS